MPVSNYFKKREIKREVMNALADGILTNEEILHIKNMQAELGIEDEYVEELISEYFDEAIQPILKRIRDSNRFSPYDEKELKRLERNLRINSFLEDELKIGRRLWELENYGEFTPEPVEADINLSPGEVCYHFCYATWLQLRRFRKNSGFVGGHFGSRSASSLVRLRVDKINTIPYHDDGFLHEVSSGTLYLTNKRVTFVGKSKSVHLTYIRVQDYELYRDAMQVNRVKGTPEIFKINFQDIEYMDAVLQSMRIIVR